MKRILCILTTLLTLSIPGWAAGSMTCAKQVISIPGQGPKSPITLVCTWIGAASGGTLSNQTISMATYGIGGYVLAGMETYPGSPAPTNGYTLSILTNAGSTLLTSTGSSTVSVLTSYSFGLPVTSDLILTLSGNSVNSGTATVSLVFTDWSYSVAGSGSGLGSSDYGTTGAPSAHILTIQGNASGVGVPVSLPAATVSTLTPLASVTSNQGTAGGSPWPVVLPATQITTLTPPAAIVGFSTAAKQDTTNTLLNGGLPAALGVGGGVKVDGSGTSLPIRTDQTTHGVTDRVAADLYTGGTLASGTNPIIVEPTFAVSPYPGTLVSGTTAAIVDTTSTVVIAAASSNYLYLGECSAVNTSTTVSTLVNFQDGVGGTTLFTVFANDPGGHQKTFGLVPRKVPTAGNGLYCAPVTTGASVTCSCSGYKSTVSY